MHGHQKKPALTKFYSLFKLTALCALFHGAAAQASTTTLAGGKAGFQDGDAASAQFDQPTGVAMHPNGFLLVADWKNDRIRKVDPSTGATSTLVGSTEFSSPMGIAIAPDGKFALVSDTNNHRIRKVDLETAKVTTLAGTGIQGLKDGEATSAQFYLPNGIAIDPQGAFALVADRYNHRIRKIEIESGDTTTLAGSGTYSDYINHRLGHEHLKDAAVGKDAGFFYPNGIAIDPEGSFALVADFGTHRIRKIDLATGRTITLAGSGQHGGFNDGTSTSAQFKFPFGIAIDPTGAFALVADTNNHRIRKVDLFTSENKVTTLAGTGIEGVDDGDNAQFSKPRAIAIDPASELAFVADTMNNRIRKVALAA